MNIDADDATDQFSETMAHFNPTLRLLYNGYSWLKTFSWNCTLYEAQFDSSGYPPGKLNMHQAKYSSITKNMQNFNMDCRSMGQTGLDNYKDFFNEEDTEYRWTIRHATGKELSANGRYDKQGPINGVTDVYRYYQHVEEKADLMDDPEETKEVKTFVHSNPGDDDE